MFFVGFHLYSESLYSHKDLCPFRINLLFVSFIRSTLLPRDLLLDLFPITDGRELFAVRVHENGADLKKFRTKVIFAALVKSVSDSPGLVDFAIGLVIFVLNLPTGKCCFGGKFKLQKDCNQSC